MKLINSNKKCLLFKDGDFYTESNIPGVWIEAYKTYWSFEGISQTRSLAEHIYQYFRSKQTEPWPTEYSFLRLTCGWCSKITVYDNKPDLPIAFGNEGSLVCPHCQGPWLDYEYRKK